MLDTLIKPELHNNCIFVSGFDSSHLDILVKYIKDNYHKDPVLIKGSFNKESLSPEFDIKSLLLKHLDNMIAVSKYINNNPDRFCIVYDFNTLRGNLDSFKQLRNTEPEFLLWVLSFPFNSIFNPLFELVRGESSKNFCPITVEGKHILSITELFEKALDNIQKNLEEKENQR